MLWVHQSGTNPNYKGDPYCADLHLSFLGIPTFANWEPKEDEVQVERPDLPILILRSEGLARFAAYWRAHGERQK